MNNKEFHSHQKPSDVNTTPAVGTRIAQRITAALCGLGIPYTELVEVVYGECNALASEVRLGDWIELPNGTTFECTFKPGMKGGE